MAPDSVVKRGTFLYGGTVECDVCVVLSPVRHGSGDDQDPPEIANDIKVDTYYLYFGSTTERKHFNAGGGGFPSLGEAMAAAERAPGIGTTIRWSD